MSMSKMLDALLARAEALAPGELEYRSWVRCALELSAIRAATEWVKS